MTEAEQLIDAPSDALQEALATASQQSAAADSLFQQNFRHEDGSLVVVTSFRGSAPIATAYSTEEDVPRDLVTQHLEDPSA